MYTQYTLLECRVKCHPEDSHGGDSRGARQAGSAVRPLHPSLLPVLKEKMASGDYFGSDRRKGLTLHQ